MRTFDLTQAKSQEERDALIAQLVDHILRFPKKPRTDRIASGDLKEARMNTIRYSHQFDNVIIAVFQNALTAGDISRIEGAADGIRVCDYTLNYQFWKAYIKVATEGTGIDEAYVYSINCANHQQVSDQSIHTFIRVSQGENLIALIPMTAKIDRCFRGIMEVFYLNISSVEDSAVEYSRMSHSLQFVDEDSSDFASETSKAVERFKAEQAQLRLRHLRSLYGQISEMGNS